MNVGLDTWCKMPSDPRRELQREDTVRVIVRGWSPSEVLEVYVHHRTPIFEGPEADIKLVAKGEPTRTDEMIGVVDGAGDRAQRGHVDGDVEEARAAE